MKKYLFIYATILSSSLSFAAGENFKSISCIDATQSNKAPVYLDIGVALGMTSSQTPFALGNIIKVSRQNGSIFKDPTTSGNVQAVSSLGYQLKVSGPFGSVLLVNTQTGQGFASGLTKYDARSGAASQQRLSNYPVNCKVTY